MKHGNHQKGWIATRKINFKIFHSKQNDDDFEI